MSKLANEPAFPTMEEQDRNMITTPGMTLRQYYAGQAMQGLLSDVEAQRWLQTDPRFTGQNFAQVLAINSVEFSDALISELSKQITRV